jgi:hypothetical protein
MDDAPPKNLPNFCCAGMSREEQGRSLRGSLGFQSAVRFEQQTKANVTVQSSGREM